MRIILDETMWVYESWNRINEKKVRKRKRCSAWQSGIAKNMSKTRYPNLETKYHEDAGDWYVALGGTIKKSNRKDEFSSRLHFQR